MCALNSVWNISTVRRATICTIHKTLSTWTTGTDLPLVILQPIWPDSSISGRVPSGYSCIFFFFFGGGCNSVSVTYKLINTSTWALNVLYFLHSSVFLFFFQHNSLCCYLVTTLKNLRRLFSDNVIMELFCLNQFFRLLHWKSNAHEYPLHKGSSDVLYARDDSVAV